MAEPTSWRGPRSPLARPTLARSTLATLAAWRRDAVLRDRLGKVLHLMSGNAGGTLLSLAAVAVTARALGPAAYGLLALAIAFVRLFERLFSFQTWQLIIRYGAGLDAVNDRARLQCLYKLGLLLDLAAGAAGFVVAILVAAIAVEWFGWSRTTLEVAGLYAATLLVNLPGVPTAVLRLAGRFRVLAYGQLVSGSLRLLLCLATIAAGGGLIAFALIWTLTQMASSLVLLGASWRLLDRQQLGGFWRVPLAGVTRDFDGLRRFAWSANLGLTLRSSANQLDVLIVGALAGPAAAGLYNVARQLGKAAQQFGGQLQTVLYPDIARAWVAGERENFLRSIFQVEAILAVAGIVGVAATALLARPALALVAGPAFAAAAPLVVIQMLAVVFLLAGSATQAGLMAMGEARRTLDISLAGTLIFHLTALALVPRLGAMGANIAHIALGLCWCLGLAWALRAALATSPAGATPP